MRCFLRSAVRCKRSTCSRGLRLYRATDEPADLDLGPGDADLRGIDVWVHARSRFRSVSHPERYALYSLHERGESVLEPLTPGDHTLVVVREFRRVPLHASALGLVLFVARAGREARVVAALAHFAERAVSLYQPPYLLLARSMEQPGITALLAGVHPGTILEAAGATAFSMEHLLPEVAPLLAAEPEWYAYCPEPKPESLFSFVSPYAV